MDLFREKQQSQCDVGGLHCDCCNKWKGKERYRLNKTARKRLKNETRKIIFNEMRDVA